MFCSWEMENQVKRQKSKAKRQNSKVKPLPQYPCYGPKKLRVLFVRDGFDPLTRLAPADESAGCRHPLPQGGEGRLILSTINFCILPFAFCLLTCSLLFYCPLPTADCPVPTHSRIRFSTFSPSCRFSGPLTTSSSPAFTPAMTSTSLEISRPRLTARRSSFPLRTANT